MRYNIKKEMIHPDLRRMGSMMRRLLPAYSESFFRMANRFQPLMMKGRAKSSFADISYTEIDREDGSKLRLMVCLPKKRPEGKIPGLLWIHGGGYAVGMPEQDTHFIDLFMKAGPSVIIAPDYTLSTEKPYPAALHDCYLALLWMKEHCDTFGIRKDQLFVGGDSAGGGLTCALMLYARDKGEVAIAFQMPLYPMIDDRMNTPSMKGNDAPVWNEKSNIAGWKSYLGALYESKDVPYYAAPARAEDLTGLPPAASFVGMIDPFFSETLDYMERLKKAGSYVAFRAYKGCYHSFDFTAANTNIAKKANAFLASQYQFAIKKYFAPQP